MKIACNFVKFINSKFSLTLMIFQEFRPSLIKSYYATCSFSKKKVWNFHLKQKILFRKKEWKKFPTEKAIYNVKLIFVQQRRKLHFYGKKRENISLIEKNKFFLPKKAIISRKMNVLKYYHLLYWIIGKVVEMITKPNQKLSIRHLDGRGK